MDFAKISAPLVALTKKDQPFIWTVAAKSAFASSQRSFTTAPVMKHFDPTLSIVIETDASDFALGSVLSQPNRVLFKKTVSSGIEL